VSCDARLEDPFPGGGVIVGLGHVVGDALEVVEDAFVEEVLSAFGEVRAEPGTGFGIGEGLLDEDLGFAFLDALEELLEMCGGEGAFGSGGEEGAAEFEVVPDGPGVTLIDATDTPAPGVLEDVPGVATETPEATLASGECDFVHGGPHG